MSLAIAMSKVGRPSKYKLEMCEQLMELMRKGLSRTAVAAQFGVTRETLNEWAKVHPEFSDALQLGETQSQAWWEQQAIDNLCNPHFQTGSWYANMKNRFGWRDRNEVTGVDGAPLVQPVINLQINRTAGGAGEQP
jgi:hypothetical protein